MERVSWRFALEMTHNVFSYLNNKQHSAPIANNTTTSKWTPLYQTYLIIHSNLKLSRRRCRQQLTRQDLEQLACSHLGTLRSPSFFPPLFSPLLASLAIFFSLLQGAVILRISDPMLTRARGSGAPGVKSYKKVKIFVLALYPLN